MARNAPKPSFTVIDGCAVFHVRNWPTKGLVQDFVDSICSLVVSKLKSTYSAVIFDHDYHYSIKSSARLERSPDEICLLLVPCYLQRVFCLEILKIRNN